jgi:hypothetical protein
MGIRGTYAFLCFFFLKKKKKKKEEKGLAIPKKRCKVIL